MTHCTHLVDLLKEEKEDLKEEIEKDKWYLSEKVGHDVGWQEAEKHFINNYLNAWAEGLKICYCNLVCSEKCKFKRQYKMPDDKNTKDL